MSGSIHLATQVWHSPTCVIRSQWLYGTTAVKRKTFNKDVYWKNHKENCYSCTFNLLSPFWFFHTRTETGHNRRQQHNEITDGACVGSSWNSLNIVQLPWRISWGKDPLKPYKNGSYAKPLMTETVLGLIYCFISGFFWFFLTSKTPNAWHSSGERGSSPHSHYHHDSAS